jgi:hypothetical protein
MRKVVYMPPMFEINHGGVRRIFAGSSNKPWLVRGKAYEVSSSDSDLNSPTAILIRDGSGEWHIYERELFISLEEYREVQINKIID